MDVKIYRKQFYDPYLGEFVYESVQSQAIKRWRTKGAGIGTLTFGSYVLGPGTVGKLTYLHVQVNSGLRGHTDLGVALVDRYGTFDFVTLEGGTTPTQVNALNHIQRGEQYAPIHSLYGTFKFCKTAPTSGTLHAAYELVTITGQPAREGTVTRT